MRRDMAAEDENCVCVWVCQIKGSKSEFGARADRELAQAWVERLIEADNGEWHGSRGKRVYKTETLESGSIELVPVYDVVGMVVQDL